MNDTKTDPIDAYWTPSKPMPANDLAHTGPTVADLAALVGMVDANKLAGMRELVEGLILDAARESGTTWHGPMPLVAQLRRLGDLARSHGHVRLTNHACYKALEARLAV